MKLQQLTSGLRNKLSSHIYSSSIASHPIEFTRLRLIRIRLPQPFFTANYHSIPVSRFVTTTSTLPPLSKQLQMAEQNKTSTTAAPPSVPPTPDSSSAAAGFFTPVFPRVMLEPLLAMGFNETRCVRALHATGGTSVDSALQWLFDHSEDKDIDRPLRLPRTPAAATANSSSATNLATPTASSTATATPASRYPPGTPLKLVFLVRADLHMRTGKIAAQVAHAAVGTVLDMQRYQLGGKADPKGYGATLTEWLEESQAKVVLSIKDEAEMHQLERSAREAGIHTHIVADAGRTQVDPGSKTVLAIGPAPIPAVDAITGHLKLL